MNVSDIEFWLNNKVRVDYNEKRIDVKELKTCIEWGFKAVKLLEEFEVKQNGA